MIELAVSSASAKRSWKPFGDRPDIHAVGSPEIGELHCGILGPNVAADNLGNREHDSCDRSAPFALETRQCATSDNFLTDGSLGVA
jgi:hypothetical protein